MNQQDTVSSEKHNIIIKEKRKRGSRLKNKEGTEERRVKAFTNAMEKQKNKLK